MRKKSFLIITFSVLLLIYFSYSTFARGPIKVFRGEYVYASINNYWKYPFVTSNRNHALEWGHIIEEPYINEEEFFVEVLSAHDVQSMFGDHNNRITALHDLLDSLSKKLDESEQRLKTEIKESLDTMPNRLIENEAKEKIEKAVLASITEQIEQLRTDLQKQIDDINKKI